MTTKVITIGTGLCNVMSANLELMRGVINVEAGSKSITGIADETFFISDLTKMNVVTKPFICSIAEDFNPDSSFVGKIDRLQSEAGGYLMADANVPLDEVPYNAIIDRPSKLTITTGEGKAAIYNPEDGTSIEISGVVTYLNPPPFLVTSLGGGPVTAELQYE